MAPDTIQCFQCYSFGTTYLFLAQSVEAIVPVTQFQAQSESVHTLSNIIWAEQSVPVVDLDRQTPKDKGLPHNHYMIIRLPSLGNALNCIAVQIAQIARPLEVCPSDLVFDGEPLAYLRPVKGARMMGYLVDIAELEKNLSHIAEQGLQSD